MNVYNRSEILVSISYHQELSHYLLTSMDFSSCETRDGLKSTGVCGVNTLVSVGFDAEAPIMQLCSCFEI